MSRQTKKRIHFSHTPAPVKSSSARDHFTPAKLSTPGFRSVRSSPTGPMASALKVKAWISIPEDWAEKQCRTFTEWLNYMFQPTEDMDQELIVKEIEQRQAGLYQNMNRRALRTLLVHQRLAQARTQGLQVFHAPDMKKARQVIVAEIAKGRLSLRTDRDIHADLNLRGKVVSLLLSYSTQWLRIGLEVLFGEPIFADTPSQQSLTKNSLGSIKSALSKTPSMSRMKLTLKNVIVSRLLADPATLRKYTKGRCNVPSGRFEKLYQDEMRTVVLTRLLVLVVFLDKAKVASILDRVPRLFAKESKVKSTKDVLASLCRDFLSSEGDITKHLSRIGVTVGYKQEPIDELDFTVENLAADIRDGVRLARMAEILFNVKPKSLLATLRLPAVSRLQKLHNVGVVLDILNERGVPNLTEVASHHIVDGYREQVLQLLWAVIAHSGLAAMLDARVVEEEITKVEISNRTRSVTWELRGVSVLDSLDITTFEECGLDEQKIRSLLLRWCNAVLSPFGIHVSDYSESFSDGIVICLLIHFYHPALLRLNEIQPTSRHGIETDQALANERANLRLAAERMSELGGIPNFLPMGDSRNHLEGKSMFLCLVYLCSRLMESSTEVLACIAIQEWYRRKMRIQSIKRKIKATRIIWQTWTERRGAYYSTQKCMYGHSVRVIEKFVQGNKNRLVVLRSKRERNEERAKAATVIQSHVRRQQAMRKNRPLLKRDASARIIQKNWYVFQLRRKRDILRERQISAVVIQTAWRGFFAFNSFSTVLWLATRLQALARGAALRKIQMKMSLAATDIQRVWRGFMCQVSLQVDMLDILTVQCVARRYLARKRRIQKMREIIKIQSFFRMILSMRMIEHMQIDIMVEESRQTAAAKLQSIFRGYSCRFEFKRARSQVRACTDIQRVVRGRITRNKLIKLEEACILLQSAARGIVLRSKMKVLESSVKCLQTHWRCHSKRRKYRQTLLSIVQLQAVVRTFLVKLGQEKRNSSAQKIQAVWRRFKQKVSYDYVIQSITKIQSLVRGLLAVRRATEKVAAILVLQKNFRRWRTQRVASLAKMKRSALKQAETEMNAAVCIQSSFRRVQSLAIAKAIRADIQRRTESILWATVVTQAFIRFCLAHKLIQSLARDRRIRLEQESAVTIQSFARRFLSVLEARKRRHIRFRAATVIQAKWRSVIATKIRRTSLSAATIIQKHVRGARVRSELTFLASNSLIVQRMWRMRQVKLKYRKDIRNILFIQTEFRRHLAKSASCSRLNSILRLQSFGRFVLAKVTLRRLKANRAACSIQRFIRGRLVRSQVKMLCSNARRIQAYWRMFRVKLSYKSAVHTIVIVQSLVRRWIAIRGMIKSRESLLSLQGFGRMIFAKSKANERRAEKIAFHVHAESSARIQAIVRGWKARNMLNRQAIAATVIQREWKCFIAFLQYQSDLVDVVIVQSIVRRRQARNLMQAKKTSLATIQAAVRRCLSLRRAKARFAEMVAEMQIRSASAIKLQAAWRCYKAKAFLRQHKAATKIQKTWRCFTGHVDFLLAILDVMTIQRCARVYIQKRRAFRATPGVTAMQAYSRGRIQRRLYQHSLKSIVQIQAYFRGVFARQSLKRDHMAATIIQRHVRCFLDRIDLEIREFAATDIQRVWRGFLDRVETLFRLVMILRIQSTARRWLATQITEKKRRALQIESWQRYLSARLIQGIVRVYLERLQHTKAACVIQKFARLYFAKLQIKKMNASVVLIQARMRGRNVRRLRSAKERTAALRIAVANENARQNPDLVLGIRTQRALRDLRTSKRLTEIMEAAKILETSTRLSINCCIAFVEIGAPHILYDLIGTCNRSLPHIEILHYVLLTLQNVSQHKFLLANVASPKATDLFLDLVQMLRDKQELFVVALTLLSRVSRNNEQCKLICSRSENIKRLNHVLKKISVSAQIKQDLARMSRNRSACMKRNRDPVKILRSLLAYLQE